MTSGLEVFERRMSRLAREGGLRSIALPVLRAATMVVERAAKLGADSVLHRRSGRLMASIDSVVEERPDGLHLLARAGGRAGKAVVRYARLQEEGGTVRPVESKFLRVPLRGGPALTAAGVDKYGGPLRNAVPEGFFRVQKSFGGKLFLVHDVGKRKDGKWSTGRTEFWYILLRSVTLPARPYLRPALEGPGQDFVRAQLAVALRRALSGVA